MTEPHSRTTLPFVPSDLTQSQEGYVETIYRLESEKRVARVKEIAAIHHVSSPAVTKSLKGLADLGLVSYEPYGVVTLSDRGRAIGRELILRYRAMEDFLRTVLGVSPELAEQVSDDFEHHMPAPVLCRLVQFVAYYKDTVDQKFSWSSTCANLCGRYDSEDCVLASRA